MHVDKTFSIAIVAIPVHNTQPESRTIKCFIFFLQVEEDKEGLRLSIQSCRVILQHFVWWMIHINVPLNYSQLL